MSNSKESATILVVGVLIFPISHSAFYSPHKRLMKTYCVSGVVFNRIYSLKIFGFWFENLKTIKRKREGNKNSKNSLALINCYPTTGWSIECSGLRKTQPHEALLPLL